MKRRGTNSKTWHTRLSAGGANKTNIQGQMSRVNQPEEYTSHRPSSSDLMPAPRLSSFRPWNSRLMAPQRQSPPEVFDQWEPPPAPPPLPPSSRFKTIRYDCLPNKEYSPDVLYDEKGRLVPKKGMFLNAKYSDVVHPVVDEAKVRKTEEMIRRIVHPRRRDEHYQQMPNYDLRDRIRRVVYDMGVPGDYRAAPQHQYHPSEYHSHNTMNTMRRNSSQHQMSLRQNEMYEQQYDRQSGQRREEEEGQNNYPFEREAPRKKPRVRQEEPFFQNDPSQPEPSGQKERSIEKRKKQPEEPIEEDSSDEDTCILEKSLNSSGRSVSKKKDDRASSQGNRTATPKEATPSPQYIRDDDDNWRNSIPFMSDPKGAGAAMFSRIGSAIPTLPLKDNTHNSYSKVAIMLLNKSIKNINAPPSTDRPPEKRETLQTQLMNMSTSWVRPVNQTADVAEERTKKPHVSLISEISKIQNPQNATKAQIDDSLFRNSRVFMAKAFGHQVKLRKEKKAMPLPRFQSSPISNDVFRSVDGVTMPSSIRKDGEQPFQEDSDEEPTTRQLDVDDYIAQGASQIVFSQTPRADPSSSSQRVKQDTLLTSHLNTSQKQSQSRNHSFNRSKQSIETVAETSSKADVSSSACASKSKSERSSMHLNSQFMFSSSSKKKKSKTDPILEFDADIQKMFDEVYDNEKKNEEAAAIREKNKEKYSF
ncbi:unnamed protein product [Caenorhabditis sp. 36 PRJEB53466]|nr:unnamed protein product [Caenorhabditis sp. 36 PRJEB53466]